MATAILVRHGRTTANTAGTLAGRSRGVRLDDAGRDQARATAERLAVVPLAAVVTSPLERCRETAAAIVAAAADPDAPTATPDRGLLECDYGRWQGESLKTLAKDPLWKVVQSQPSAAAFPDGESLAQMSARVVGAVRRRDAEVAAAFGDDAVWVAVSHGDPIKAVVADALGMHLDLFQRLVVDPASVTVVRYTATRPYVLAVNTHAGDLGWLRPPKRRRRAGRGASGGRSRTPRDQDAVVGGGAGPAPAPA